MEFSNNLIKLRKMAGLSQEELGHQIDVTRQTISKWELGSTTPELDKLVALANFFKVSTDQLITGHEATSETFQVKSLDINFKSNAYVGDIPLVHINIGPGYRRANGIIAIGNYATGVISFGGFSVGVLAFGGISAGILSLGGIALGVLAVGGISVGALAVGGIAIGYEAYGAIKYILKDILF